MKKDAESAYTGWIYIVLGFGGWSNDAVATYWQNL